MQIIKEKQDVTLHLQEVRSTQGSGKKHKKAHSTRIFFSSSVEASAPHFALANTHRPLTPFAGPLLQAPAREFGGGRDGIRHFSLPVCSFSGRLTPHSLPCSETLGRWLLAPRPQCPCLQSGDDNCPPAIQQTLYTRLYGSREKRHTPEW